MVLAGISLLGTAGCHTVGPLPPVDLKAPGWSVREGQAVWHRGEGIEIAGEVLVALVPDGDRAWVQFMKTPFPIVQGQVVKSAWELEIPTENRRYSAPGHPPKRLLWLQLPRILRGEAPPKGLLWQTNSTGWKLANLNSGESIEGYFAK
jgi:hypothetical protein